MGSSMASGTDQALVGLTCDEKDFKQAFEILDQDGSGYVTAAKLQHVMTSLIGENPTEAEVQDLISANDDDGKTYEYPPGTLPANNLHLSIFESRNLFPHLLP